MDCRGTRERIHGYLDGELPREEADRLERHAAACPSCGSLLEGLRAVDRAVASQAGLEGLDEAAAKRRVLSLLAGERSAPAPRSAPVLPFLRRPFLFPLSAAAAVLAAAVLLWRYPTGPASSVRPAPSAGTQYAALRPPAPSGSSENGAVAGPSAPSRNASVPSLSGEDREVAALMDLLDSPALPERNGRGGGEGNAVVDEFLSGENGRG